GNAGIGAPGGLVGRGLEALVAAAALAALGRDPPEAGLDEVGKHVAGLGILDDGAGRDLDRQVLAILAGRGLAAPLPALPGAEHFLGLEVEQRPLVRVDQENDAAALAAVAAVRAALRDVLLAPKRNRAGAAVAGLDADGRTIRECAHVPSFFGAGF